MEEEKHIPGTPVRFETAANVHIGDNIYQAAAEIHPTVTWPLGLVEDARERFDEKRFVERPIEYDKLLASLLDRHGPLPIAITTALMGAGGYGKTTLAKKLVRDPKVGDCYADGIAWITLGQEVKVDHIKRLYHLLTGAPAGDGAKRELTRLLKGKRVLLVVDDVWRSADLDPFLAIASTAAITCLFTTRRTDIAVEAEAREVRVDQMQPGEAWSMLARRIDPLACKEQGTALGQLARDVGQWPLLLRLVNGMLRQRLARKEALPAAIASVNTDLERRGVVAFDPENPVERDEAVAKTMAASLDMASDEDKAAYLGLGVFPEDCAVPVRTAAVLWGLDEEGAEKRLLRLDDLALLSLDLGRRVATLHDVFRDYIISRWTNAQAPHERLLGRYAAVCKGCWPKGPKDGYFHQHLVYHLVGAAKKDEARRLLLDPQWMMVQLEVAGVAGLLADYVRINDARDETLGLVAGAIRLSVRTLANDRSQLASQLLGRLLRRSEPEITALLDRVCSLQREPWLRPLRQSLTAPGGPLRLTLEGHSGAVNAVAVTRDGRRAVSASDDHTLRVWDLETGETVRTLEGHSGTVNAVAVTPDGRRAVSASRDHTLRVWDLETGETARTLEGHSGTVNAVAVTRDGRRAVSGSDDHTLRVWDIETGKTVRTIEGQSGSITAIAVTPDGRRAVSASEFRVLRVWDLETGKTVRTIEDRSGTGKAVAVTRDGRRAVSASTDHLRLWDLETGETARTLEGHSGRVLAVAVTRAGWRAVSASDDHTLRVWDLETGETARTLEGHSGTVNAVAVTRDGSRAVSASDDHTLRVWDLETGETARTLEGHSGRVLAVAVTRAGRRAVSASNDHTLRVWDLETGKTVRTIEGQSGWITAIAVTPDGRRAVAGCHNTLRVWDLETGETARSFPGHSPEAISAVAVTPDGRRAVFVSQDDIRSDVPVCDDRTLPVWDLETGKTVRTLEGHSNTVEAVAVTPDGRCVVSGSTDHTLRVWDIETGEMMRRFDADAGLSWCAITADAVIAAGDDRDTVHLLRLEAPAPNESVDSDAQPYVLGVETRGGVMTAEHQRTMETVLHRLNFLASSVPLPAPYRAASGVAGRSAVYFLALPRGEATVNLVAKFDEPERAAKEWHAIDELRTLNTPPLAMLPIHGNVRSDEVIIYHDASAVAPGTRTCELDELLRNQIATNPASCVRALDLMWQTLDLFYRSEPGAARPAAAGAMLRWERAFPKLRDRLAVISEVAARHWPWQRDWQASVLALPPAWPLDRPLPNPLARLAGKLGSLTGPIMLSRVHGDLNLHNVLISVDGAAQPVGALIIDLANSERDMPTALDLARLETEIWHEVFTANEGGEDALLSTFIVVRDCLEGRSETLRPTPLPHLATHYLRIVGAIRQHALGLLRGALPSYMLEDYATTLYLQHAFALSYPSVNENPITARIAIAGAALALEFLNDLRSGRYAPGATSPLCSPLRTYEEMTSPPPEPAVSTHPATSQEPSRRGEGPKYHVSIGDAENVFIGDRSADDEKK